MPGRTANAQLPAQPHSHRQTPHLAAPHTPKPAARPAKPFVSIPVASHSEAPQSVAASHHQAAPQQPVSAHGFRTPQDFADDESGSIPVPNDGMSELQDPPAPVLGQHKKRRFSKKQWIIISILVLLLAGGGAAGWWFFVREKPAPVTSAAPEPEPEPEPPKPTTERSKLTGLQVDPAVNKRQVTAVMIENSPDARPQSGLLDAGLVFEAVAEGGITRFCALFQDTESEYIGPIRSVRPYYIDWFMPFDAAIAHVGGSPQGLADIKSLGAKDLDQFANSGSYQRVSNRFAPHNVYSSTAKFNALEDAKKFTGSTYTGFARKDDSKAETATAKTIDLDISSALYNVHYDYDAASNRYNRSVGGKPHKDEKTGAQLNPKVVIAIVMQRGIASDGQHTQYTTVGSGKMYVFQDGIITEGTWSKTGRKEQWKFTTSDGSKEIELNAGQTWIAMVDMPGAVTYKP